MRLLTLCGVTGIAMPMAAAESPTQPDTLTGRAASDEQRSSLAHPAIPAPEIVVLTRVDHLKRLQTADVYTLGDAMSPGSFSSTGTEGIGRLAATTADRPLTADRATKEAKVTGSGANPEAVDSDLPDSKLAALVATVIMVLLLIGLALIGARLRRHRKHGLLSRGHHKHGQRSAHRFIAYDVDRQ